MSSRCDSYSNTNTLVGLQNIETFSELYIFLCSLFLKYSIVLKLSIALKQWLVYDLFQVLAMSAWNYWNCFESTLSAPTISTLRDGRDAKQIKLSIRICQPETTETALKLILFLGEILGMSPFEALW